MARSIAEIENAILAQKEQTPELSELTSDSRTSIWGSILYLVAYAIWTMEKLFDLFKAEVDDTISRLKPHSLRWYAEKAKAFQYGFDLIEESDVYDNTGFTESQIQASKIVSYAAVVEQIRGIRIKVAKSVGTDLGPLTNQELDSFTAYMREVKDAGVKLSITSGPADMLLLGLTVRYDPLVLNSQGQRLDGSSLTPVKDAIKDHLKNLPFNGVFSVQSLVDTIQAVDGVADLSVDQVQTKYGALPFTTVNITVIPDAGYLRIDDADLTINYQAAQ